MFHAAPRGGRPPPGRGFAPRRAPAVYTAAMSLRLWPLALLLACAPEAAPAPGEAFVLGRVVDGDTVTGVLRGQDERVRLVGVDAPELGQGRAGARASAALSELLRGELRLETAENERDRYGRVLGWLWAEAGGEWTLVNAELVRQGHAFVYLFRENEDSPHAPALRRAEAEARAAGRNVWDGSVTRPHEWRRRER